MWVWGFQVCVAFRLRALSTPTVIEMQIGHRKAYSYIIKVPKIKVQGWKTSWKPRGKILSARRLQKKWDFKSKSHIWLIESRFIEGRPKPLWQYVTIKRQQWSDTSLPLKDVQLSCSVNYILGPYSDWVTEALLV